MELDYSAYSMRNYCAKFFTLLIAARYLLEFAIDFESRIQCFDLAA